MYVGNEIVKQLQHRLDSKCSNFQAEQSAILKAIEAVEKLKFPENRPRTLTVFTDSRTTTDSLKTPSNQAQLIEGIRKGVTALNNTNWRIEFS